MRCCVGRTPFPAEPPRTKYLWPDYTPRMGRKCAPITDNIRAVCKIASSVVRFGRNSEIPAPAVHQCGQFPDYDNN